MKKTATLVFSLLFAVGLSTARSQEGAVAAAPAEASIGALTYDEVYALYSYLDFKDIDGDGNGVTVNGRFSNKQNFFSEVGLNWFNTEITLPATTYRAFGQSFGTPERTIETDVITLYGGIGSWLPITENFHIVGSGGVGLFNASTDGGGDTTDVTLQGEVLARWLVFGFIELNGGYTASYSNETEDTFHGPIYGGSVNISKTWQLILRARLLNDDYDEYGVGVRYRW